MKTLNVIVCLVFATNSLLSQTSQASLASETSTATLTDKHMKDKKVPSVILNKFKTEYPNEQPTWSMDNDSYRASFVDSKMMNGHAVAYDKNGTVVYREEQLAKDAYPAGIVNYFTANYPNEKYGVWSSMDKSGKPRYFSNHNLEILWFDENGKYVKTVKSNN